jgi:hypothetical protein
MPLVILSAALCRMPSPILVLYVDEYEILYEWLPCQGFYSCGMLCCAAWLTDFNMWKERNVGKPHYSGITLRFLKMSGAVYPATQCNIIANRTPQGHHFGTLISITLPYCSFVTWYMRWPKCFLVGVTFGGPEELSSCRHGLRCWATPTHTWPNCSRWGLFLSDHALAVWPDGGPARHSATCCWEPAWHCQQNCW